MKLTYDELARELTRTEQELDNAKEVIAQLQRERRRAEQIMLTDKQPCKRLHTRQRKTAQ